MYYLFKRQICKSLNFMGDESLAKVQAALGVIFNLFSKPSLVLFVQCVVSYSIHKGVYLYLTIIKLIKSYYH